MPAGFCQRKHNPEINEDWFALRRWTADVFRNERLCTCDLDSQQSRWILLLNESQEEESSKNTEYVWLSRSHGGKNTTALIQTPISREEAEKWWTDWGVGITVKTIFLLMLLQIQNKITITGICFKSVSHRPLFFLLLHIISNIARMFQTSHQLTRLHLKRCRHFENVFLLRRPAPDDSLTLVLHAAVRASCHQHSVHTFVRRL